MRLLIEDSEISEIGGGKKTREKWLGVEHIDVRLNLS